MPEYNKATRSVWRQEYHCEEHCKKGCGVRLRLAYWVAQVGNANALDHRRVAKADWRAHEAVEESNSRAKKNRRDVDVDFVEVLRMGLRPRSCNERVDPVELPAWGHAPQPAKRW